MPIPDDQLALLQTAVSALHNWQDTAEGAGIVLQQIVMEFPPGEQTNQVRFTWDSGAARFDIST